MTFHCERQCPSESWMSQIGLDWFQVGQILDFLKIILQYILAPDLSHLWPTLIPCSDYLVLYLTIYIILSISKCNIRYILLPLILISNSMFQNMNAGFVLMAVRLSETTTFRGGQPEKKSTCPADKLIF